MCHPKVAGGDAEAGLQPAPHAPLPPRLALGLPQPPREPPAQVKAPPR